MKTIENDNLIFIRLFPEEDVINEIINACKKHKVRTAILISGIGQLKKLKLGYFKDKGNYSPKLFNKPLEILSLTGNIIRNMNDYNVHLHIVVGDENKKALGGHLIEGKISITGEIVLLKTNIEVYRKINKKTGLKDLFIE